MPVTKNQQLAIESKDGNYLVSASAGSGKTFVLTERVFDVITKGTKLSELLILTFTNLAAAEMRDRIRAKLIDKGDEYSLQIAASLDAANIQTYDAYALNIVKKYYYMIGLSKDISLVDQTLLELEEKKIITSIFEEHYRNKDERVLKLVDDYCLKNNDDLKDFIIAVSHKFDLKENKQLYLDSYLETYFSKDKIVKDVDELISDFNNYVIKGIKKIKTFENIDYVDIVLPMFERFASKNAYDEIKKELDKEENQWPRLVGKLSLNEYPDDKKYHEYLKGTLNKFKDRFSFETLDDLVNQYLGNKDNVSTILDLVKELDTRIKAFKKRYNVYSFSDIFKFALEIVSIPEINKELKNKYKYIMIDEYQDTSDIQEIFINKIANNNVYVVGDIKQSIYRFRNANCDLFLDKFNRYEKGDGGKRIELPENFRSRKEVVDAVNKVFSPIMKQENTGLDYAKEHQMIYGNTAYISANSDYSCEVLTYSLGEKYLVQEHEARLIATDIATKINEGFEVYDKDKKELRKATYSDFAIIMYAKRDFAMYQKVFNEYQIPLYANYDKSIRENNLTMTFENIITLLYQYSINDKSKKFKHSFISVLRSFLFETKDNKIADLAFKEDYENYELYKIIEKTYEETKSLTLKEKIAYIIKNFDIYNKLILIGDISANVSLLEYYYSIASQMDDMGYELKDFKQYFDDLKEFEIDPDYSPSDDVKDCVKLLSIHASKGLQFKICYFAELYKQFNNSSSRGSMLVDSTYGIDIPNVYNKSLKSYYHDLIVRKEKADSLLEQLRVFYVALTRAEEKIILLKNVTKEDKAIQDFAQCNKFIDFVNYANPGFKEYSREIELIKRDEKEEKVDIPLISFKDPIKLSSEVVVYSHASKALDDDVDNDLLLLGNKYHYYLELMDFSTLDTSFIKDENDRRRIDRFLSNPLFKDMKDANVMHEYPFFDEVNNVHGVIDLLVEHTDHIDIIDFKLSHVDDVNYEKQLNTYKRYISTLTNKKINTYVTGILSGQVKQIN